MNDPQITLETEIAEAVKKFEAESGSRVVSIRIDRYGGPDFCIATASTEDDV